MLFEVRSSRAPFHVECRISYGEGDGRMEGWSGCCWECLCSIVERVGDGDDGVCMPVLGRVSRVYFRWVERGGLGRAHVLCVSWVGSLGMIMVLIIYVVRRFGGVVGREGTPRDVYFFQVAQMR